MGKLKLQSNYIDINGASIFYEDGGSGPPLIMLHQGISTHNDWIPLVNKFMDHFHVFIPDMRGRGKSDNPYGKFDYPILADDIAEFCHILSLEDPSLVGWGDSGVLILDLMIRYPSLAQAAVILSIDWQWIGEKQITHNLWTTNPSSDDLEALEITAPDLIKKFQVEHGEIYGSDYWKELITQISSLWFDPNQFPEEKIIQITKPVMILHEHSIANSSVFSNIDLYRRIPGVEMVILPGGELQNIDDWIVNFEIVTLEFLTKHTLSKY